MIRLEIIANRSVEENIFEALEKHGTGQFYTKIPVVLGVGKCGPRMGDAVWPEENFMLIIWCKKEKEAEKICEAVAEVQAQFPEEGVRVFSS